MEPIFVDYIKTELAALPAVLYALGLMLKQASFVKDKNIPLLLGITGVVLSLLWTMGTSPVANARCFLTAAFAGISQGILSAGAAVYVNQLLKQQDKDE